ncbi:MAG: hypothetical protein J7L66_00665 [Anaerolineaceae bacterium]|nr:hypothetical protein [Anaerolineaceae bacterium]
MNIKKDGGTRARLHDDAGIKKIVLVSTGGWYEKENFDTVVHIIKEFALNSGVEFSGAVIQPYAFLMWKDEKLTTGGKKKPFNLQMNWVTRIQKAEILTLKNLDLFTGL